MGDSGQAAATKILTEHLTYTPLSLIDDIINSINTLIYKAVNAVELGLIQTPPSALGFSKAAAASNTIPDTDDKGNPIFPEAKAEIENGVHELETLLEATVDKDFDKFEIYCLRNVLSVPEDVASRIRLAHYEGLTIASTPDTPTPESITAQRRKLVETQKLHAALLRDSAHNQALICQLRSTLAASSTPGGPSVQVKSECTPVVQKSSLPLSLLTSAPSVNSLNLTSGDESSAPLTTNVQFIVSQLPTLRALLASIRPKLAAFPETKIIESGDGDLYTGAAEERRLYIESQTRRHLVRTQGLELDEGGVRDREWTGGGRKIEGKEVGALERVIGMLGGDKSNGEQMEE